MRKTMAADFDLPNDCWECVIKFLHSDHRSLESLSLVSKQFLSDTNRLRLSLTIYDPIIPFLPRLFHRFTNLTSLDLTFFFGDLNSLLRQISSFPFHLKSLKISKRNPIPEDGFRILATKMKTLTSLTGSVTKTDIVLIAEYLPFLEEVDLNFPEAKDRYTNILPLALPKLRKINISGCFFIDDSSLFHLCKFCEFLEELVIIMHECCEYDLTHVGIASAISETPNLKSFAISFGKFGGMYVSSKVINSIRSLKSLTFLNLSYVLISDRWLTSLAEAGLPLKRLVINRCMHYSYAGIFCLLSKCRFLQHLDLEYVHFLTDQQVAELSLFLGNLVSINLSYCKMLTDLALFALVKNCRFLGDIRMEHTGAEECSLENYNSLMDFVVYPQVKSLHLANNRWLIDESIEKFASIFPNLQVFDTSKCDLSDSIVEVLRCCKIMHLILIDCPNLELLGMNFQVPKLEILNLSGSTIDDQTLYMISKNFSRLRHLDLQRCNRITEKGVRQVVENCTRLREINMRHCRNVAADVDFWLAVVFSRPSLRKIIAPSHFNPNDSKWIPLLDHGCLVC